MKEEFYSFKSKAKIEANVVDASATMNKKNHRVVYILKGERNGEKLAKIVCKEKYDRISSHLEKGGSSIFPGM